MDPYLVTSLLTEQMGEVFLAEISRAEEKAVKCEADDVD
jgi:hypothetical protein